MFGALHLGCIWNRVEGKNPEIHDTSEGRAYTEFAQDAQAAVPDAGELRQKLRQALAPWWLGAK
jgi:hypothetical protein